MNPAFEESAMFENMVELMFKNEYDVYVFDTAPTANARRLLGMSKVYSLWVNKMLKSREEARSLRELLSFTKKKEADPLMDYLVGFRDRMAHARDLTDDKLTAFFFVTLLSASDCGHQASSIGSTTLAFRRRRAREHAHSRTRLTPLRLEFVRNRCRCRMLYMTQIWSDFDGCPRNYPVAG
jgi:hypothetical protein